MAPKKGSTPQWMLDAAHTTDFILDRGNKTLDKAVKRVEPAAKAAAGSPLVQAVGNTATQAAKATGKLVDQVPAAAAKAGAVAEKAGMAGVGLFNSVAGLVDKAGDAPKQFFDNLPYIAAAAVAALYFIYGR